MGASNLHGFYFSGRAPAAIDAANPIRLFRVLGCHMRSDMAKVIVERPRHGSRLPSKRKGYARRTARIAWEDQPRREGMKLRSGGGKSLNEHLSPLRRYLAGQVGRPWDRVFADICRHLDRGSAVQDHVRDHVDDYVAVCVVITDGELRHSDGWPLRTPFYVCPRTGILKKNRKLRRWYFRTLPRLLTRFLDDGTALVRKDGAWYIIEWRELHEQVHEPGQRWPGAVWDVLLKTTIFRNDANRIYGRPIYAVSARRAAKKEVRRTINSYPYPSVVRSK